MALELVAEDGSGKTDANSYAALESARDYAVTRLGADAFVAGLDNAISNAADDTVVLTAEGTKAIVSLIMASDELDLQDWEGYRLRVDAQRLQFPRSSLYDQYGHLMPSNVVPRWLFEATVRTAIVLYGSAAAFELSPLAQFETIQVGSVSLKTRGSRVAFVELPESVQLQISPFLRGTAGGGGTIRLVRG